jgi:hypothetical protein
LGNWFLLAHPEADSRSIDALEYRAAWDGSLVVTAACKATHDTIVTALEAASLQLGMSSGTLLIHPDKTIPVVWGLHRWRLLLPVAAALGGSCDRYCCTSWRTSSVATPRQWDANRAAALVQSWCGLPSGDWEWNVNDATIWCWPACGSAYAGHLLEVVMHSRARWTRSYGLAMARQSSIEGRLVAVLSETPTVAACRWPWPPSLWQLLWYRGAAGDAPRPMKPAAAAQPSAPSKTEPQRDERRRDIAVCPPIRQRYPTKDERHSFKGVAIDQTPNGLPNLSKWNPSRFRQCVSPDGRTMLRGMSGVDAPTGENSAAFSKGRRAPMAKVHAAG